MLRSHVLSALVLGIGCLCGTCAHADQGTAQKPVRLEVQGDRLTGHIEGAPLRQVLAELRQKAGIRIELIDPADDDTVSESFHDLPLLEAIRRLLKGRSFVLYGETARAGPGATAHQVAPQLVILPRTRRVAAQPGSAHATMERDEATRMMVDPDENVRARAQEIFEQSLANQRESPPAQPHRRDEARGIQSPREARP